MDKGKKKVTVEEIFDDDIDAGTSGPNVHRDALPKEHSPKENEAKQCICHCPLHPPPPPKREVKTLPCGCKTGGRNLIVCIDGTANQFGQKNTNVIELYNLVQKRTGDDQLTWYNSGIGTYVRPDRIAGRLIQFVDHTIDTAIAWHFKDTVVKAYRWLSDNYQDGDCIYLFGFSRGAHQVRTLAGMIEKVGLIHKGNEAQISFAYELYVDPNSGGANSEDMARRFKEAFCREDVKVHFVGAWDTVSSIGFMREKRMLPLTTSGMTHVCFFRHALALDERRVKFQPEYAYGCTTLPPTPSHSDQSTAKSTDAKPQSEGYASQKSVPHTLEVWFAGTHSDIGGGNRQNLGMDRSRPPLRWMASEAEALGLRLRPFTRELLPSELIEFKESLKGPWHIFEILPIQRLKFARTLQKNTDTYMPHFWSARKIHPGQKIHSSLILADTPYIPKARPPKSDTIHQGGLLRRLRSRFQPLGASAPSEDGKFWQKLRKDGLANSEGWLEIDLFAYARILLKRRREDRVADNELKEIVEKYPRDGPQAVYDGTVDAILAWSENSPDIDAQHRILLTAIRVLEDCSNNLSLRKWSEVRTPLHSLERSGPGGHHDIARRFLTQFTDEVDCLLTLRGHTSLVLSVSFSSDGTRLASGSADNTIRIWDTKTGFQVAGPLRGHTGPVWSVTFSPDGKHILSGSHGNTLRIWDAETGKPVAPLQGHADRVLSVAISPDGKRIVSGYFDNTIRIGNAETGEQVVDPLRGHTDWVRSVAISHDGKLIVSGSDDGTIRIWDIENGKQVGATLEGHTEGVLSVAISPDGKKIVSGSYDETIRIWDIETDTPVVGEPLVGHTGWVQFVAISPDGKYIVSGSRDKTVRVWDLEKRAQVGDSLRGHTGEVWSVAISPDGQQIASGSRDNTIRIWSTEGVFG